jgi:hypothetical protein
MAAVEVKITPYLNRIRALEFVRAKDLIDIRAMFSQYEADSDRIFSDIVLDVFRSSRTANWRANRGNRARATQDLL